MIALLAGCSALSVRAQQEVCPLPLDSGRTVKGHTFGYMLPATAFKVDVTVRKVRELRGHYADYAQTLLGLQNVIAENRTFYEVAGVRVAPVRVPDPECAYLVRLSESRALAALAADLAGENSHTPRLPDDVREYAPRETQAPEFFRNFSDVSYAEKQASFVETRIIDGVVTQVPANRSKTVQLTASQKAREAADYISKSRQSRFALMNGEHETPYTEGALKLMIDELTRWEQNYLSLFAGLTLEDEIYYTFYVTPSAGQTELPLFACDPAKGLTRELGKADPETTYALGLNPLCEENRLREMTEPHVKKAKDTPKGYRIRKAVPVQVTLLLNGRPLSDLGTFNMSQYGRIRTLPAHLDKFDIREAGFVF